MNEQHETDTENLFLLSVIFTLHSIFHFLKTLTVLLGGRENENENYI
jgi:hypothetical protein